MRDPLAPGTWQRISAAGVRGFHAYASWLVSISWKRFFLLAILLIIASAILQNFPPFSWKISEHVVEPEHRVAKKAEKGTVAIDSKDGYEIKIDDNGVHIGPRSPAAAASAASAAGAASAASAAATPAIPIPPEPPEPPVIPKIDISLPKGADSADIKEAVAEAKEQIEEAIADAKQAREDAKQAREDAKQARQDALDEARSARPRVVSVRLGDYLVQTALLFILASVIIKINYKSRLKAEVQAAQATETAESESLKRQVIEARMAAMQAQIEPHFLFNTLASIDHLIEVDPPRASAMQKNLIALLRASMPSMRESNGKGVGHLGRELAVVRPYLEILKVRMEERLQTEIDVPEGLLSADFPPMMIQGLVENAIKHGLEPKPEGGRLSVKAEIMHGKLAVTVADTGLGFGKAPTAGTGVGLENIRERLQLLYGRKAQLAITANSPSGTRVTITVPYATNPDAPGAEAAT